MGLDRFLRRAVAQREVIDLEERKRRNAVLRFQIPLGITALIMASTFTIVNAGLARTIRPEAALAAFALGQTVTNLFASPLWSSRNMMIALGRDHVSMSNALKVTFVMVFGLTAWIALLGYTSLGALVYAEIFGAPRDLLPDVLDVVRLCILLPTIYAVRGWGQAVILIHRKTPLMIVAMLFRLGLMMVLAMVLPGMGWFSPTGVGGAIWVAGMLFEAIGCALAAAHLNNNYPNTIPARPESGNPCSVGEIVRFIVPLVINGYLGSLTFPAINAALARGLHPERSLAAFQVAWSVAFLFVAFVHPNLGQTILVFLESGRWWQSLRKVGYWIIGLDAFVLAVLVLSGGTGWILSNLMGIETRLLNAAQTIILVTVSYVILGGLVDMWVGVAMKSRSTAAIGIAKAADVSTVIAIAFGSVYFYPAVGGIIGPIALGSGLLVNLLILRRLVRVEVPAHRLAR
ncbi:MAG: hypothetical protein ACOCVQ_00550 [Bacillota bacterium]